MLLAVIPISEYMAGDTQNSSNNYLLVLIFDIAVGYFCMYIAALLKFNVLKRKNQALENALTEKEQEIVKRGRNAENHHLPKNADPADYMYSTAFEGLIGYLYLTKQDERLKEIFKMCKE